MAKTSISYKKGNVDILLILAILLVLAFSIIIFYKFVKEFNTSYKKLGFVTQESKDIVQKVEDKYVALWDGLFLTVLVLFIIFLIITSFMIDSHPIFFFSILISLMMFLLISGIVANIYSEFIVVKGIATEAGSFKIIPWIFSHLILIGLTITGIVFVALYAKFKGSET